MIYIPSITTCQYIYLHICTCKQALDAEEAQKLAEAEVCPAGKSAWNKGGTTW